MSLRIESAALITSFQDAGRSGYLRFGLPPSGPMDWWAFRAANLLLGNPPESACVEVGMSTCSIRVEAEVLLAACGSGYRLFRNQQAVPLWMSFLAKRGDLLTLEKCSGGNWAYLAAAGGIPSAVWLGSRSVYPRGHLGAYLRDGDRLPVPEISTGSRMMAGRSFPPSLRPAYTQTSLLRVIQGPDAARFEEAGIMGFFGQPFQVSAQSDRMGYRLSGPAIKHLDGADIVSRGMAMGEIQVPGDGQPIVLMADHPTTGGYTSLGAVAKVDLPLLAQTQPGIGELRFTPVGLAQAQSLYKKLNEDIKSVSYEQEDLWLSL